MTYESLSQSMTGRCAQRRKLANNTYAERREGAIAIRLHNTDIVTYHAGGAVTFDSGGWRTVTTKARMNEFSPARISQTRGVWFIRMGGMPEVVYIDSMTFDPKRGEWSMTGEDPARTAKLVKGIAKFVRRYMAAFEGGEVLVPGAGDCWGCYMKDAATGKPVMGTDHLLEHMKEDYFVPSLLSNAIDRFPVSMVARAYVSDKWAGTSNCGGSWADGIAKEQLQKSLYRYMKEQLGVAA